MNRRETATMTGGTTTTWGYNDRGEVNSESEALPGPVALPLLENGFTYDGIGNRLTATGGGRTKAYTPKAPAVFNQYASITQPAFFPVTGKTVAGANVIVNTQAAQRAGQYFWAEVPVANAAGASFPEITVRTALPGAGANGADLVKTSTQRPYMRPASTSLSYDDDGNLTQDARWDYTWDAENRLISMTERRDNVTAAAGDPAKRKLDFGYDAQSRRTRKTVSQWNAGTSAWTTIYEHTFVWSGWHLVHEKVTSTNTALANERSYVWGIDHSGNGGYSAGTLVFYRQYHQLYDVLPNGTGTVLTTTVPRTRPVAHDLQGNLIGVISSESASHLDAVFDYDCFGNERQEYFQNMYESQFNGITVSKSSCPLRFSGQYFDPETKLSYYGYRYYSAEQGRWLSRDPIGEDGGINLYEMVGNNPVNRWDYLGLSDGPGISDQFNPLGLRGGTRSEDYTKYFNKRFPKTIAKAKERIRKRIRDAACEGAKRPVMVYPLDVDVRPDGKGYDGVAFGDDPQGFWESHQIGYFEIKAEPVFVKWQGNCTYSFTAKLYVEETTGANNPLDMKGIVDLAWWTGMFSQSKVRMAEWEIYGDGMCANCCEYYQLTRPPTRNSSP